MPTLGERFAAAREARGLSLSDVSEQIRIRSIYLAAIEDDNWSAVGAPVYVRGFLRTYARFLGLPPEEVVSAFNEVAQPPGTPEAEVASPAPIRRQSRPGSLTIWAAGLVAVLLVAFVVYNELTIPRGGTSIASATVNPSPLASMSAAGPTSSLAGEPQAAASPLGGANTLALVISAPSWLRVTVDGSVSMEGTFPAGTSKTFHGKNALVRIGNAGGVEIFVDGKDVGKLGKSGDVAERAFTL
jgi:cytoskeleton protein RodZ